MTLVQFSMKFFHYIQQIVSTLNSPCPFSNGFPSPVLQQKHPHLLYSSNPRIKCKNYFAIFGVSIFRMLNNRSKINGNKSATINKA